MKLVPVCIQILKGAVTVWPLYAQLLEDQKTVLRLLVLLFPNVGNSWMSFVQIDVKIFKQYVIIG